MTSLKLHACLLLRNTWGWGGLMTCAAFLCGMVTFLTFAHMFNVTPVLRFVGGMLTFFVSLCIFGPFFFGGGCGFLVLLRASGEILSGLGGR